MVSLPVLPRPRSAGGAWSPGCQPQLREVPPPVELSEAPFATWADLDDGCMVLVEQPSASGPLRLRWVNRATARVFGYAESELVGEPFHRLLVSPFSVVSDLAPLGPGAEVLIDDRRSVRRSITMHRRDGSPLRMDVFSVPVGDEACPAWVVRLVREPDVERVADDLRASHERFRALADRAPIAIFSSESGLRLAYVNDRFSEVYGENVERLLGTAWLSFVHPEDQEPMIEAVSRVLGGEARELPLRIVRRDGEERFVRARIVPVPNSSRDTGFVGTLEDVTERQAFEATLAYQASHDSLTGLLNRRRLLEALALELQTSHAADSGPALLFLDLDDFKLVNDSLGHDAGDRLLVEVSRRLKAAVREGDLVSRFGGDEFAVLCTGLVDEEHAGEVARRVLDAVTGPVNLGSCEYSVSGSIGVVVAGPGHAEAEDVLRDADVAMYQAKAAGKDCWALFDEQARLAAQRRLDLVNDLRRALDADQLDVHYQPVVRLDDLAAPLSSVEALARWEHPEQGMVPPSEFVQLAEENGLVVQLGMHVLRTACRQMVRWHELVGDAAPSAVSVNVSALQLRQSGFPEQVAEVLRETGLPGRRLCLELTETVVMHDANVASDSFGALRALGVRVSIDDFGTGYSSLSLLRSLTVDQLKIDRSFLPDLGGDAHDPVVAAVVALGRALGLDVVAEGVETPEQVAELRRLGCPLAQGYLFGRPLPADELTRWLRAPREVELAS